jgi:hypothetical protein
MIYVQIPEIGRLEIASTAEWDGGYEILSKLFPYFLTDTELVNHLPAGVFYARSSLIHLATTMGIGIFKAPERVEDIGLNLDPVSYVFHARVGKFDLSSPLLIPSLPQTAE